MVTLQAWLEQNYPNKDKVTEIELYLYKYAFNEGDSVKFENYPNLEKLRMSRSLPKSLNSLTIINCPKLKGINCSHNNLSNFNLDNCPNLVSISVHDNQLTNVDFLTKLSNPEKLKDLSVSNNNIQPTTLDFLKSFVNLEGVWLGVDKGDYEREGKTNLFYGSLEPLKYFTKLKSLCIAGTDVDSGLEYLPDSLVQKNKEMIKKWGFIGESHNYPDCQPIRPNARVKTIQDQLRPFNYDLEAWRLINIPNLDNREQLLGEKFKETQDQLNHTRQNEADKIKKIERLESKLKILEETKNNLEKANQELVSENTNLFDQLTQLKNDREGLTNKLQNHEQTLANLRSNLEQNQAELTQLKSKFSEVCSHNIKQGLIISELENTIKSKESELIILKEQQIIKEKKITELQESLQAKEAELTKLRDNTSQSTASLRKEIHCLKDQIESLKTELNSLQSQATKISDLEREINCLKSEQQDRELYLNEKDNEITNLNNQLKALVISSGLQLNNLTTQLTNSEQENRFKENFLKSKDKDLSEQEQKLKDYEFLLRQNDENLAKCQAIITEKSDQLDQLELDKNNLQDQLDQAGEKINQLESDLSLQKSSNKVSQTKIQELEEEIKKLSINNPNSAELVKLKAELTDLKTSSQAIINDLKNQLQQVKANEEQLAHKIQQLTKNEQEKEIIENSWWSKVKTPLACGGIMIILLLLVFVFIRKAFQA